MHAKNFRKPLREAVADLDEAIDELLDETVEGELAGIAMQLEYYLEGDTTDPEARMYPPPWAIETIEERLADCTERVDDPAAQHVRNARSQLEVVIPALADRLNDGRTTNRP